RTGRGKPSTSSLLPEQLLHCRDDVVDAEVVRALERSAHRRRSVRKTNTSDGRFECVEHVAGYGCGDLRGHPAGVPGGIGNNEPAGLTHRRIHCLAVPGLDGSQVDELGVDASDRRSMSSASTPRSSSARTAWAATAAIEDVATIVMSLPPRRTAAFPMGTRYSSSGTPQTSP